MENIRSEVRKWIETIEDYDLIEVWNKVSEHIAVCKMDSLDDLLEDRRIKEIIEIIDNCESNFNIYDEYVALDKVNDCLISANSIFDLINEEYLIKYIVDTKKDFDFQALKDILNPYGLKEDDDGFYYQTEKRKYRITENKTTNGKNTDIYCVFTEASSILEENTLQSERFCGWFYSENVAENEDYIKGIVKGYEAKESEV